jgi:hypothetical protein
VSRDLRDELLEQCLNEVEPEEQPEEPIKLLGKHWPSGGEWTCPDCRNMFAWDCGTRTCTRSKVCICLMMPYPIRAKRIAAGKTEQGLI